MYLRHVRLAFGALCVMALLGATARAATIASLTDDFTADVIDGAKWNVVASTFEAGTGTFTSNTTTNTDQLTIAGTTNVSFWGGQFLRSVDTFSSSVPTLITVDRVSQAGTGSAHRTALQIRQTDGTFVMLSQNIGEGGWKYNLNTGGGGQDIALLNPLDGDLGNHQMSLLYVPLGGGNAAVISGLDGKFNHASTFRGPWQNGIDFTVDVGSLARAAGDTVTGVFDNFNAQTVALSLPTPIIVGQAGVFPVANDDLLTGLSPTVIAGGLGGEEGTSNNGAMLTNGNFGPIGGPGQSEVVAIGNNDGLRFDLDLGMAPLGYDITEIDTFTGWQDSGRNGQNYVVMAELLDDPGNLVLLGIVADDGPSNNLRVALTNGGGLLASHVTSLYFFFGETENGYTGWREIDVIGTPSIVPEPASMSLLALGGLAMLRRRKRTA